MTTQYANFFRVTGTFEEVMLDFGLHTGLFTQQGPDAITINQRVVISFPTAKRLLEMLARSVAQHEQLFGQIEVDPQKRLRPEARAAQQAQQGQAGQPAKKGK
jgi:hypothetical protein